ncbi:oxidoreductase [Aureimonas sp. SA4125]|uniref:molybdopterin-dependent oxidoreductase n=1 Tax=Aureimonas sp. SA4125 TaxID=2826993 RepID=UPI001CC4FCDB|nr:molybdopterin-dependent oxidoreductase [Aureimonas sp. SA4125]BDA82600.1 oxidoreductase [Aureimonas sp. SA4125]
MASSFSRRRVLSLVAGATVLTASIRAEAALTTPKAAPVLRIGGHITEHNEGDEAVFDMAGLEALGTRSFATSTPWTDGVATWEGVLLADLMDAVGASGTTIRATALNDYVADVPMRGLREEGAILAMRRDGRPMPISNKGPLFILYPFDDNRDLQQQSVYMRCAWQIARLDIL